MDEEDDGGVARSISRLPVGCISEILSLTSPLDVCRASAVSHLFKSAADSNAVWERFLPSDYREIIAKADPPPPVFDTKRQLYFRLSDSHILLDGGKLSFMIDKFSGKKCYMIRARDLLIAWKDDTRYWKWGPDPESRFLEVGILKLVCWLEIRGKIGTLMLSTKTAYAAYLVFRIANKSWGLAVPAKTILKLAGAETETSDVYLEKPSSHVLRQENERFPQKRKDGWMEIELGEFFNDEGDDGEVEMVFEEIRHGHSKSGLVVEGIEFRPK